MHALQQNFVDRSALSLHHLQEIAPAAFASTPDTERTSARYTFISTAQLVGALLDAGFQPTHARQTRPRNGRSIHHARHMLRFSHIKHSLTLVDAIPEIVLINSHDGTTNYVLSAGLYRPVCTNGMITPVGDFAFIRVPHRGNIIADVVDGALTLARGFADIGAIVQRMHATQLEERARWDYAAYALQLRYQKLDHPAPITADQLLLPHRDADYGNSLWQTFNVVQENVIRGGIQGHSPRGRATRTRGITAIREDVRINAALWQHAMALLRS